MKEKGPDQLILRQLSGLSKPPSAPNWPVKSLRLRSCNKLCSNGRLLSTTVLWPLFRATRADPDDTMASRYTASHPKRRRVERVRNFPRRWPAWSGPSAQPVTTTAYGCQPAKAGHFWALYGLLRQQERSAYAGRPGVRGQLLRPFREFEEATASRLGALLNDLLSWAKAQSSTAAPAPGAAPPEPALSGPRVAAGHAPPPLGVPRRCHGGGGGGGGGGGCRGRVF
jgi:hypothetical protein